MWNDVFYRLFWVYPMAANIGTKLHDAITNLYPGTSCELAPLPLKDLNAMIAILQSHLHLLPTIELGIVRPDGLANIPLTPTALNKSTIILSSHQQMYLS